MRDVLPSISNYVLNQMKRIYIASPKMKDQVYFTLKLILVFILNSYWF